MNQRPLLLFPTPNKTEPSKRNGGGNSPNIPSVARQAEILGPKFSRLEDALDNRRIDLQHDVAGVDPEYTVVIETYGSVADFFKAVRKIDGLEWLGEFELRGIEPNSDFYSTGNNEAQLNGQVMLVLSDRRAIDELLSLWRRFIQEPDMVFERGFTKFRDLFRLLKDIRYWGVQDRLQNTGILGYWAEALEYDFEVTVRFEAELWFRVDEVKRNLAQENVELLTQELGGRVISSCCIPEIHYQSLLLELPYGQINNLLSEESVSLIRCDQVMLFRPLGQMTAQPLWSNDEAVPEEATGDEVNYLDFEDGIAPRIALFDGLPLSNHLDLQNSLIIDDPDDFERDYPAANRIHGTAMASLIINGDLNEGGSKLNSPVYVRPIMKPDRRTQHHTESLPDKELPLDIIHRAVRRLFEFDGDEAPACPTIKIINLSIGDPNIHFDGRLSPFARLLDWLSYKYNVLFIVSAGNHAKAIRVPQSGSEFHLLSDEAKAEELFKALQSDSWYRKLLSPAESVNAITIGALHSDVSSPILRSGIYNLYTDEMPASYSAHGNGYVRSVKPDLVFSGGKMLHNEAIASSDISSVTNFSAPGHLVAYPQSASLSDRVYIRGTSNSAALASRSCGEISDILEEVFAENEQIEQFESFSALLLKSLLAHGASWGEIESRILGYLGNVDTKALKDTMVKNIGYGKPDTDRVKYCLDSRATILGYGELNDSEAHVYKLPIPEGMSAANIWRRLTITLSWFAKPCATNLKYRNSALWFTVEGDNKHLTSRSSSSVDWMQVKRGTLQHEIFEGEDLAVISEEKTLEIKVNCKEHAAKIIEPVKYGIAITLEVAEDVDIQLYQEIESAIMDQIRQQSREPIPTR